MREADVSDGSRVPHGSRKHIKDLERRIAELQHWQSKEKRGSEARANYTRLIQRLRGKLASARREAAKKKLKESVDDSLEQYESTSLNPNYAIRFVESLAHQPDANRTNYHSDFVVNGVYAFPLTREIIAAINNPDDDSIGLGAYIEDIALPDPTPAFILKCNIKNPLVLTPEVTTQLLQRCETEGGVNVQQSLVNEGYDALLDPNDTIDSVGMPQVLFLSNSAFSIVKTVKL